MRDNYPGSSPASLHAHSTAEAEVENLSPPERAASAKLKAVGYAARHSFSKLKRFEFERDRAKAGEIEIQIVY